jgi:hypothetical protein
MDKQFSLNNTEAAIQNFIQSYVVTHQKEMAHHMEQMLQCRNEQAFKTGRSKDYSIRLALSIPTDLYISLKKDIPKFEKFLDDKKNVRWMMQTFPFLTVPERI